MNAGALWVGQGVLYEIYIRSFFDHSGDGVGDFRGISEKMEYIARLGVKGIILAPQKNSWVKSGVGKLPSVW